MTRQPQEDLNWQALRYVASEMDPPERDGFERRLADSQAAREAVAEAVELTQAVKFVLQAEPVTPAKSPASFGFSSWWLGAAMGSAACLLIMLGIQQANKPERAAAHDPDSPAATSQDNGALAARWSEVRQRENNRWNALSVDDEIDDSLSSWDNEAAIDEQPQAAPEWMMAAVSAAKKSQGMGEDMDRERSVDGPLEQ